VGDVYIPILFKKDSPLRAVFDKIVLKLMDSGIYNKWMGDYNEEVKTEGARWITTQRQTPIGRKIDSIVKSSSSNGKALSITNYYGILVLACISLIIASFIFVVEISVSAFLGVNRKRNEMLQDNSKIRKLYTSRVPYKLCFT
jgi:hypothetical protein